MKRLLCFLLLFSLLLAFAASPAESVSAQVSSADYVNFGKTFEAFHTTVSIALYGDDEPVLKLAAGDIAAEFELLESVASASIPTSDIARFNALDAASTTNFVENVHPYVIEMLSDAKRLYAMTGGAFNPCAYLLNDLWQLSSRFGNSFAVVTAYDRVGLRPPQQKYIDAFKNLMDFDSVVIETFDNPTDGIFNRITKTCPPVAVDGVSYNLQIDLGAIAKGYAADRAKAILTGYGITQGNISAGGSSVIALGSPFSDDGAWSVKLINPEDVSTSYLTGLKLKNAALATSGDYQLGKHFYYSGEYADGLRYCHIMDTKTGAPIRTNIRTASAWGGDLTAAEADAITTAVMVMGAEQARVFMTSPQIAERGIRIVYVYEREWALGSVFEVVTNAEKSEFTLASSDFRLCGYYDGGGFVYRPLSPNLWFGLTLGAAAAVIAGAVIFARLRRRQSTDKKVDLKKQPFFRKADIFVYSAALVLVAVLLIVFVFAPQSEPLLEMQIIHNNVVIFTYDFTASSGTVTAAEFTDKIFVSEDGETTYVRIDIDGHFNLIAIKDGRAWMSDADCSWRKDCVHAFPKLEKANQVIICEPHGIKLVGQKQGIGFLVNG